MAGALMCVLFIFLVEFGAWFTVVSVSPFFSLVNEFSTFSLCHFDMSQKNATNFVSRFGNFSIPYSKCKNLRSYIRNLPFTPSATVSTHPPEGYTFTMYLISAIASRADLEDSGWEIILIVYKMYNCLDWLVGLDHEWSVGNLPWVV